MRKVPDAKTIWKFKNDLAETETVDKLFCMFDEHLEKEGETSGTRTKKSKTERFPRNGKSPKTKVNSL